MAVQSPIAPRSAPEHRPGTKQTRRLALLPILRANPLAPLSVAGLVAGLIARYGFDAPRLSEWLWLGVLIAVGVPLVLKTGAELLHGRFHADVIASLAIGTALIMGEYLAGVLIVVMQTTGEGLERHAFRRASSALDLLIARAPRVAHRFEHGNLVDVDASDVRAGDHLVLKPGELVPVDARVIVGRSSVDQSALTGEPVVVNVETGSDLLSGSLNLEGALEIEALRTAAESQYERIVTLVRAAQSDKPPLVRIADRAATVFTPLTLVMCALAWIVTGDPTNILSVLVVATPCPLILAVPVAVFAGINAAADRDIIVKHGAAIERIGTARAVAFDKTGTLTGGAPEVLDVIAADGFTSDEVLHTAASLEQLSSHQLGRALAQHGAERVGPLAIPEDFAETTGRGVRGRVAGRLVEVGSRAIVPPDQRAEADALLNMANGAGTIRALVLLDGRVAGVVTFADRLRPGVRAMTDQLRALGVERIVMLTGDNSATARAIGDQAGIGEIEAELLPSDKVDAVRRLKQTAGSTLMVGDGTNDAPALATATVGIAMGARGTGISAEAADIVLLKDDVTEVVDAIRIGRRMRRIALQSVAAGIGLSLGLMVLAVFGFIRPTAGALMQEVIDVVVVLNALRARGRW
jgi:heavy metal translocating P-type ATPase